MRSLVLLTIAVFYFVSINGLLRPKRAGKSNRRHYNKDAIRSHIAKKRKQSSFRAHASSSTSSTSSDITTATDEMWASCDKRTFDQALDHYGTGIGPDQVTTFNQRYYLCGRTLNNWQPGNPIFFYFGNEADVTAYIDYTGFMWEQGSEFNALLVFAEHRYYGESMAYTQEEIMSDEDGTDKLSYLTTDQALEDYAVLIDYLQKNTWGYSTVYNGASSAQSAIIGFGGSYGGMLATYFRMKYPMYVDGVVAGSSPIWGIFGLIPEADPYAFSAVSTHDASPEVGVDNELCKQNIKSGWHNMLNLASTETGRAQLAEIFNLCDVPQTKSSASVVLDIVEESISYMSMSSYPYASNYISGAVCGTTTGSLPAYPMKTACNEYLTQEFDSDLERVRAIGSFNAVFWNSDGLNTCLDPDTLWDTYNNYIWDYLYCRSLLMPSGSKGGDNDMLMSSEWSVSDTIEWCNSEYNIAVDIKGPASRKYGGRHIYKAMSNIVFSNGNQDPWYPGGVLTSESDSLVNILIDAAGHHLDLMFSNSADPQSVIDARAAEVEYISGWISQANNKWNMGMCDVENVEEEEVDLQEHPWISAMNMLL
mmetsp:Transcript_50248/g.45033  ORF Transcript_50248/g.45033 Transcript_50248/m.45033 type:complete len:592 (-) Transcript_50248:244-2019(-)